MRMYPEPTGEVRMSLSLRFAAGSHKGMIREGNEDSGYAGPRLLAPFDPIAWDRGRFERFFGWAYRFEAYTPPARRTLGYYALPLLWIDRVIGWANVTVESGRLRIQPGYVAGRPPRSRTFRGELESEAGRMRDFLQL